jgi:hypothetical protein
MCHADCDNFASTRRGKALKISAQIRGVEYSGNLGVIADAPKLGAVDSCKSIFWVQNCLTETTDTEQVVIRGQAEFVSSVNCALPVKNLPWSEYARIHTPSKIMGLMNDGRVIWQCQHCQGLTS